MADASPFAPTDTYDDTWAYSAKERLPAGHPTRLIEGLRDKLPAENKELPKPRFFMDPRATSLVNMVRGSLDTVGRWVEGKPKIGEDTLSPTGAAGVGAIAAKNLASAPTQGHLSGFIGPGQVGRLNLTPGSRGSLGALEKAQETWAKGGTDPGALAETWSKHGWAPPESFGVQGHPFSWLQMPELRLRDDVMDMHQTALRGDGFGGSAVTEATLRDTFQPGPDLDRLLRSTPELGDANVRFKTGHGHDFNGVAGTRRPDGRPMRVDDFKPTDMVPKPNHFEGVGPDPFKAESILIGHELRGHGLPKHGGTQLRTIEQFMAPRTPMYDIPAIQKIENERTRARAEWNQRYSKDPSWDSTMESRVMKRWLDQLKEMKESAARGAAYFAQPEERMARHAHVLDQLERGGANPFAERHAPGVMSTYTPRSLIDDDTFAKTVSSEGLYTMRDMLRKAKSPFDLAPVD